MKLSFGSRDLRKCLECLGFKEQPSVGSSHLKYTVPKEKSTKVGIRPFFIVILGKKTYDPNTASKIIKQIIRLGFTTEEIFTCLGYKL